MSKSVVTVLGGGSFGTVIANIIANNGYLVKLWVRSEDLVSEINNDQLNNFYLPDYKLNKSILATSSMADAVSDTGLIFLAVPSSSFRSVAEEVIEFAAPDVPLISTTKGIEERSFQLMSQILLEIDPRARVGVLSGPNLAKEIARNQYSGTVIASDDKVVRSMVMDVLKSEFFRVYANDDMYGVELGGSLKNIYAVIAGIASELGMGHNTNSLIVTRGLAEMARFGRELGADPMTFLGLSGVGDLVVTCSSPMSRNFRFGSLLGRGLSYRQAEDSVGQVVEGINTLKVVFERAEKLNIHMPLAEGLFHIVFNGEIVESIIPSLMSGEHAMDVEFAASKLKEL
ncbi:MAG: NAD(P)H-dependent glycerol-3-phosphate dehydrogenase [Deltaproteobacteria bacterium]|jgi:glycerol-3-phosphate dehydrogenase (NAD(P)+)|nr:NAD(P)H-dependent glycerol-3-phosphate dehydrogenase [Deltaproteobacteria bacterium]|tara:strand:+ start:508 stop:1536 length:1029 start_codon:yes stop_codon:yes gene_type:complete